LDENELSSDELFNTEIPQHREALGKNVEKHFAEDYSNPNRIKSPFSFDQDVPEDVEDKEPVMISDSSTKGAFIDVDFFSDADENRIPDLVSGEH